MSIADDQALAYSVMVHNSGATTADNLSGAQAPDAPTPITARWSRFTTVALGDECILPAALPGAVFVIRNDGAESLNVIPFGAETINGGAPGAALALAAEVTLRCYSAGQWQEAVSS